MGPPHGFQADPDDVGIIWQADLLVVREETELTILSLSIVKHDGALPAAFLVMVELAQVGDDPLPWPGLGAYDDTVSVPDPGAVNNLTVAVDLTDQASVSNLNLTLFAPNGDEITLVQNQIDATGKAYTSQGLPSGNAIGQFGFTTGTTGTPGISVGTIFDDNATRNIFDPTTTGINGNNATDYIGYFQPEGGSLKSFIASLGGDINGTWKLEITNYGSASPAFGELNKFNLQFSTGMIASAPSPIATTLVTGAIGNTFARAVPSTPNGVGPGLVLGIDNTLGPPLSRPDLRRLRWL